VAAVGVCVPSSVIVSVVTFCCLAGTVDETDVMLFEMTPSRDVDVFRRTDATPPTNGGSVVREVLGGATLGSVVTWARICVVGTREGFAAADVDTSIGFGGADDFDGLGSVEAAREGDVGLGGAVTTTSTDPSVVGTAVGGATLGTVGGSITIRKVDRPDRTVPVSAVASQFISTSPGPSGGRTTVNTLSDSFVGGFRLSAPPLACASTMSRLIGRSKRKRN
jgi:hypothetical protein